jgi:alcohol dehydrogenase
MDKVIAHELEILGSHGMQAFRYTEMFEMILSGKLNPELLIGNTISLDEAPAALMNMNKFENSGITVIKLF